MLPLLLASLLLVSCNKDKFKINTDDVDLNIKIERFDQDFMAMDPKNLDQSMFKMSQKYGEFFARYTTSVVMLGNTDQTMFKSQIQAFIADSAVREVYNESQKVFADVSDIQKETNDAFKYIKYYFPGLKIPRISMHVSGFNQNIVITPDLLSISIDNYLGSDYALYKGVAFDYQLQNMTRSKVAPDILLGFIMSNFQVETTGSLLNVMLSRAKILYLQSIIMPHRPEEDIMGYTKPQLDWCVKNEQNMWTYLMENKQLYNNSQLVLAKYINPAPFTASFTQESPGQAALWVGLQVVKSYMDNNSVTLPELMKETDYQKILEESMYKP